MSDKQFHRADRMAVRVGVGQIQQDDGTRRFALSTGPLAGPSQVSN